MTDLTEATAATYVRNVEATWGLAPTMVVTTSYDLDGLPVVDVQTCENYWTVWQQPDGTLYGEC